jgi:hypothetical protein
MGFWSDYIGDGNSFTESVANAFTKEDGASYVGGQLVDDNTGASISPGGTSSTGHTIAGTMNSSSNDNNNNSGSGSNTSSSANTNSTSVTGQAPTGFANMIGMGAGVGIVGKLAGWANGLDKDADLTREVDGFKAGVFDGRQVYVSEGGMQYSYNFLGLPYEVKVEDGKVVDALSIRDPETGQTGYEKMAQEQRDQGNDDGADAIMQQASDNASDGSEEVDISADELAERILKFVELSGVAATAEEKAAIAADPMKYLTDRNLKIEDIAPTLDVNTDGATLDDMDDMEDIDVNVTTVDDAATVDPVTGKPVETYTPDENVITDDMKVDAVTGEIRDENLVDESEYLIDIEAAANGQGVLGNALNDFATQNISTVIDTSTAEGKLLAQALGEGNYTDSKATVLGQAKLIAAEFKDSNGNARIPAWAQGVARDVSKSISFGGMSGTAATEAMANAIMESTLGIADKDAKFFQTITIQNLDNRQEAIINKAKTLATFATANLSASETAAVQNAKAFLEMDLTNLTNEQQAEVINKQAIVDALFKNTEAINAAKLFTATERNDAAQFYDELNVTIARDNANTINTLAKFNAGELNDNAEYVAELKNNRQQFVKKQQYFIDKYNADWRQTVATTNNQMAFDAASADIKNALGISQEAQNAIWDDADSILDYIFKASESDMQREYLLLAAQIQAQSGQTSSGNGFLQSVLQIGGAVLGSGDKPWWLGG